MPERDDFFFKVEFYSLLKNEMISDEDYKQVKKFWKFLEPFGKDFWPEKSVQFSIHNHTPWDFLEYRDWLFEMIVLNEVHCRFNTSHEFWETFSARNKSLQKKKTRLLPDIKHWRPLLYNNCCKTKGISWKIWKWKYKQKTWGSAKRCTKHTIWKLLKKIKFCQGHQDFWSPTPWKTITK